MSGFLETVWNRLRRSPAPVDGLDEPLTTEHDIRMCFRLLLDRKPNPEEWAGHSAQAGHPLGRVVAGYVNSLEFARRGLTELPPDRRPAVAEHPGFRIYASADDIGIGRNVLDGAYEPEVTAVFRDVLRPGMAVIDIGANIGFFAMLSASIVGPEGAVLAVEPNPANARMMEASRRLNGFDQVTVAQVAASDALGLLALNTTHSNGTTSEPGGDLAQLLQAQTVACIPVDTLVDTAWPMGRRARLIKVDVEGAEYKALRGAEAVIARDRPVIISEFSPDFMPGISGIDGPGYLRWLHAHGYAVAAIRLDGPPMDAGQDVAAVMEEYARRNADHIDLLATPI